MIGTDSGQNPGEKMLLIAKEFGVKFFVSSFSLHILSWFSIVYKNM